MKIYVSCPADVPASRLLDVIRELESTNYTITYWDRSRNSYKDRWIEEADLILFILPNNGFSYEVDDLPTGVKRELKRAGELGKSIGIIYRPTTSKSNYQVYQAIVQENELDEDEITGVRGTSNWHRDVAESIRMQEMPMTEISLPKCDVLFTDSHKKVSIPPLHIDGKSLNVNSLLTFSKSIYIVAD